MSNEFIVNGVEETKNIAEKLVNILKDNVVFLIGEIGAGKTTFTKYFVESCGLYDGVSAEENVAMITGQPVGRKQNALKKTGNALGGATIGAVGLALLSKVKWIAPLFKSKPLWAAIAGAIGGAIAAPAVSQMKS